MSFTPAFQALLDACTEQAKNRVPKQEIQTYFLQRARELGPYERLNNMYRIRPKRSDGRETARISFFRMNRMQEAFWQAHTNRDLVLKMRQGGVTTFSCLVALDMCLFNNGVNAAIMAHVLPNVKRFFKITKLAFTWFQRDWGDLYPVTNKTDNVSELEIAQTGSALLVCTDATGLTLDFLHISEAALVEDERIMKSTEAVPLSGWVIMETTADTASGMFYELWQGEARDEVSLYKNHFFEWWFQYPESEDLPKLKASRDFALKPDETILQNQHNLTKEHLVWRRLKIAELGGDVGRFNCEYPSDPQTCFLSGSRSVFPADVLAALWKHERPPSFIGDLVVVQ